MAQLSGSLLHSLHHFQRRGRGLGVRAWTLPGSFLHLHRGRGGGEGLDTPHLCRSLYPHLSPQQWACYCQPHKEVFSMAPSRSVSLLPPVKTLCVCGGEAGVAACPRAGGMQEDFRDYNSRCPLKAGSPRALTPAALLVMTGTGAAAAQRCPVCVVLLPDSA